MDEIYRTYRENHDLTVFFVWGHFLLAQSDGEITNSEVKDLLLSLTVLGIDAEEANEALQEGKHLFSRDRVAFDAKLVESSRRFVAKASDADRFRLFQYFLDAILVDEILEPVEFAFLALLGTLLDMKDYEQLYLVADILRCTAENES